MQIKVYLSISDPSTHFHLGPQQHDHCSHRGKNPKATFFGCSIQVNKYYMNGKYVTLLIFCKKNSCIN